MNLNKFITLKHQTHFDGFDVLLCVPKTTYTCFTTDIVSLLEPYFEKHNFYFDIKTFYLDGKQSSPVEMKHVYGDSWGDLINIIDMSNVVGDNTLPVTKDKTNEIKSTPVFGSDLTNISLSENKRNIKLSPKSKKTVIKHMTLDLETALTDNVDGTKVMKIICASLFWFGRDPKLYFDYAHSLVLNKVVDKIHSYTVHLDNKLPYRKGKVKLIKELFDIIFEHGNIKEPMWKDKINART